MFFMTCGAKEPMSMPAKLAKTPANWAGNSSPAGVMSNKSHVDNPNAIEKIAPWVVAFAQYSPKSKGMKAPTKVTC